MAMRNDYETTSKQSSSVWRSVLKVTQFKQSDVHEVDFKIFGKPQYANDDIDKANLLAVLFAAIKRDTIKPYTHLKILPKDSLKDLLGTKDQNGVDLLTIACLWSRKQLVEYLIDELHADVQTPITFATNYNVLYRDNIDNYVKRRDRCFKILLQNGLLELLVRKGANINAQTDQTTLLLSSIEYMDTTTLKQLIKLGANPEVPDAQGNNLLMSLLSSFITSKFVIYLVKVLKVDINKANNDQNTALHFAVKTKDVKVVGLLLQHGAKLTLNNFHLTAPKIAALIGVTEMVEFFISYSNANGQSLLTQQEKADLLELHGCCTLIFEERASDPNWSGFEKAKLWLRAERLRKLIGLPTPDYESCCNELVKTLSKVVPDLLPIQLLPPEKNDNLMKNTIALQVSASQSNLYTPASAGAQTDENTGDDDAVILNRFTRDTYRRTIAHLLIRQQSILGVQHPTNFVLVASFMASDAQANWHHLAHYLLKLALQCKKSGSALFQNQPVFLCHQIASIMRCLWFVFYDENFAEVSFSDFVGLFELSAEYLDCLEADLLDDCNASDAQKRCLTKFSVSVLLCCAGSMLCTKIDSFTRAFSQPGLNTNQKPKATGAEEFALFQRLEQAVRRLCNRNLRGLRECTLLHYAFINNAKSYENFFNNRYQCYYSEFHLHSCFISEFMKSIPKQLHFENQPDAKVLDLLVRAGADCNARNDDGNTPLHLIAIEMASMMKSHYDLFLFGNLDLNCHCVTEQETNYYHSKARLARACKILKCVLARAFRDQDRDVNNSQMQSAALQTLFQALYRSESDSQHYTESCAVAELCRDGQLSRKQTIRHYSPFLTYLSDYYDSDSYCSTCGEFRDWYSQYAPAAAALCALEPFTHSCVRNKDGKTYLDILDEVGTSFDQAFNFSSEFKNNKVLSLQCLCALSIRSSSLNYKSLLPLQLAEFVTNH